MKTRKIFYLFILLLLLPPNKSTAQPTRGLILLGNFKQSAELSYQSDGQTSSSEKSTISAREHLFTETYRFDGDYAIYNPRLLRGHLSADLQFDQELFGGTNRPSGEAQGYGFHYNLTGILLQRSPYPINLLAGSGVSKVQRSFARSFDLETDNYGAGIFLKNNLFPVQFNYSLNKTMTSGLASNREQVIENISLIAKHKVKNFSYTEVNVSHASFNTKTTGDIAFSESFSYDELALSNQLTWDSEGRGRILFTNYRYRQELGDRESNSTDFSEGLDWDLGKTLKAGAKYSHSYQKALSQTKSEDTGELWLKHSLFQSLKTNIQVRGRSTEFPLGTEQEVYGMFGAAYQKILPAKSLLQLSYAQSYGIVDRNVAGSQYFIKDERVKAAYFIPYSLQNPDVIPGSIIIRNANQNKRPSPYVEGINGDYTVELDGRLTIIIINPAGEIPEGDTLFIDYLFDVNPTIKFAYILRNMHGSLLLFDGRYRLFAGLDEYNQDLLSGRGDATNLLQSSTIRTGLDINWTKVIIRAEYIDHESTYSAYKAVNSSFSYTSDFARSSLTCYLKDRLIFRGIPISASYGFSASGTGRNLSVTTGTDNSLSVGAVYRRSLLKFVSAKLTGDYLNATGQNSRDALSLGMGIQARFGKIVVDFKSSIHWLFTSLSSRRDDLIRLDVIRYF